MHLDNANPQFYTVQRLSMEGRCSCMAQRKRKLLKEENWNAWGSGVKSLWSPLGCDAKPMNLRSYWGFHVPGTLFYFLFFLFYISTFENICLHSDHK